MESTRYIASESLGRSEAMNYRRFCRGRIRVAPTGALVRSALIGGNGQDGVDGIYVDSAGNVFFVGTTNSTDFPTTPDAFQVAHGGDRDAVVVLLSADFSRLLYSTYMGGKAFDTGRSACLGPQGDLYVTGATNGPGWPVKNAVQATFAGTNDGRWGSRPMILGCEKVGFVHDNCIAVGLALAPEWAVSESVLDFIQPGRGEFRSVEFLLIPVGCYLIGNQIGYRGFAGSSSASIASIHSPWRMPALYDAKQAT